MIRIVWGIGSALFAIAMWQLIVVVTGVPHFILPSPAKVAETLVASRELIAWHASITITEVLVGLVIGSVLGVLTALQLMAFPLAKRLFMPIMVFSQAVPVFALAPLLTLWLGYGIGSKIMMAVLIIYFPVASNFFDGLQRTDKGFLDLAQTMKADQRLSLIHI